MKKLVALFVIVAAFLSLNNNTFSQPQFTIHVTGGYDIPMPDLKGDFDTQADSNTYFIKQGFGFGADGKYYLGKKRNVGITLALGYQMFSNDADTSTFIGVTNIKNKLNAFNFGVGVEYAFLPKGKANPFIGAEFTGHFFSGDGEYTSLGVTTSRTLTSASRFGAAFGAGVDIAFNKSIGMVIGGKYHMANLIGKDSVGSTATEFGLDDKEYMVGTTTVAAKNISYIQAYLGISFDLNQPKKTTKK